ncbi:hypothetical protein AF335_16085 [Streptomyces eurocidicus]|uniref:Uncharacterized protein n=1 Tax=Streptomyces eurocidicus TaxID=66423 RepID=A0A2N8NW84_STREU|nr:hypothetical protein [Streptomyces eurocidicus]PNE33002.1 hypothetical protein AF335_16085 [Streptomyces eurocidicus]
MSGSPPVLIREKTWNFTASGGALLDDVHHELGLTQPDPQPTGQVPVSLAVKVTQVVEPVQGERRHADGFGRDEPGDRRQPLDTIDDSPVVLLVLRHVEGRDGDAQQQRLDEAALLHVGPDAGPALEVRRQVDHPLPQPRQEEVDRGVLRLDLDALGPEGRGDPIGVGRAVGAFGAFDSLRALLVGGLLQLHTGEPVGSDLDGTVQRREESGLQQLCVLRRQLIPLESHGPPARVRYRCPQALPWLPVTFAPLAAACGFGLWASL